MEGIGLVLLIPLLSVIINANSTGGVLHRAISQLFTTFGITSTAGQLDLLLLAFAGLMIVRAVVILHRDIALTSIQVRFVEKHRAEVVELLAAARWQTVSQLRHARVAQIMGGDIQRVGMAALFFLQSGTAVIMLVGQLTCF